MPRSSFTDAHTPSRLPSELRASPQTQPGSGAEPNFRTRGVDGLAFSNGLPAAIAAGLSLVASHSLGATNSVRWALLAASGTFVIYGLDRLRDTTRDRETSPQRTDFVERHAAALRIAVGIAALVLAATLVAAPQQVILLCLATGAIGLLHRRLKAFAIAKSMYVSVAWVAICVGIPGISGAILSARLAWVATIFFAALAANLVASNLRDDETQCLPGRPSRLLGIARALALAGVLVAWLAPYELEPLGWIPLAEALALGFFRPSEHYGHLAVDGALLIGSLASLLHFALR